MFQKITETKIKCQTSQLEILFPYMRTSAIIDSRSSLHLFIKCPPDRYCRPLPNSLSRECSSSLWHNFSLNEFGWAPSTLETIFIHIRKPLYNSTWLPASLLKETTRVTKANSQKMGTHTCSPNLPLIVIKIKSHQNLLDFGSKHNRLCNHVKII